MSDVLIKTKNMAGTAIFNQSIQAPCIVEIHTQSRYFKFEIRESGVFKHVVKTRLAKKKNKKKRQPGGRSR